MKKSTMGFHPLYLAFFSHYHAEEYWEAHEVLEELWQTQRHNDFYHGLIQVAAVMHQLKRGKIRGARKLARSAIGYLSPFAPEKAGVNVSRVLAWLQQCLSTLPEKPSILAPQEVETMGLGICPLPALHLMNRNESPDEGGTNA
ncbi:DUF309 domain-containing protein [Polycladomyces subterraneus]|uniref:DUF309 domain-containing protein n=1 Tax=Polycladomyces subterraneus TaxID=1016997 RepID=A0ABT8IRF8_9BACL|nr:DUF309 domain-containing protein [Polycladomyces subterraneus]MDN4595362.1 DUF309 domain-containing protein [Polycladomyces subterraneus]